MILRGSGPVLLRNPIFFFIFMGVRDPAPPPLDPHMRIVNMTVINVTKAGHPDNPWYIDEEVSEGLNASALKISVLYIKCRGS